MNKIAFLCSGGGGNLRFVEEMIRRGRLPDTEICAVLTDRECGANEFARSAGIRTDVVDYADPGQATLLMMLGELQPDLVITTVHRILAPAVVSAFTGRMLNLHYSLLPAFAGEIGTRPVAQAIRYGAKFVGTTVHLVEERVDMGKPVVQSAIPVTPQDSVDGLMNTIFRSGCIALFQGVSSRIDAQGATREKEHLVRICDRASLFSPPVSIHPEWDDEAFWQRIAGQG